MKALKERTKTCSNKNCTQHNPQPLSKFYKDVNSRTGLKSYCKTCGNRYTANYRNSDAGKTAVKKYNSSVKAAKVRRKYKNSDTFKKYIQTYRGSDSEKEDQRKYYTSDKGRASRRNNKERRRTRKQQLPATLTVEEWQEILKEFNYTCAYCPTRQNEINYALHQEHVIPLSKGGGYTKENIVPSCASCNAKKGNKLLEETNMKPKKEINNV